jgi:hypothetical protein
VTHTPVHEFAMVAASILVVVAGVSAIGVDVLARRGLLGSPDRVITVEKLLVAPLVVLSLGAAAIHFGVIGEHFAEWWAAGVFFVVTGWFQASWAVLLAVRRSRVVVITGAVVNAGIVAVWLVSRSTGLPFGPSAGAAEAIGLGDSVATLFEVCIVVGAAVLAGVGGGAVKRARLNIATAAVWQTVLAVAIVVLTFAALANVAGGEHSHADVAPPAEPSHATAPGAAEHTHGDAVSP